MKVTRIDQAKEYTAPKHHGVAAVRLQGKEATSAKAVWVGFSTFEPSGGAELSSAPTEKIYVVLEGEITVITAAGAVTLRAMDSCLLEPNEERSVENRSGKPAKMLVISPE